MFEPYFVRRAAFVAALLLFGGIATFVFVTMFSDGFVVSRTWIPKAKWFAVGAVIAVAWTLFIYLVLRCRRSGRDLPIWFHGIVSVLVSALLVPISVFYAIPVALALKYGGQEHSLVAVVENSGPSFRGCIEGLLFRSAGFLSRYCNAPNAIDFAPSDQVMLSGFGNTFGIFPDKIVPLEAYLRELRSD